VTPVLGSTAVTGVAALILHVGGYLEGPVLFGGNALGEALILVTAGAAWAYWILIRRRPGLVGSLTGPPTSA
jgi:hypothetical protein